MSEQLYGNLVGPWGVGSGGPAFVLGTPFIADGEMTITALGYLRPDVAGNIDPTAFRVYDTDTGDPLGAEIAVATPSGFGWQWTALGTPLVLPTGTHAVVCALYPYQASWGRIAGSSRPEAPVGVLWQANTRRYIASSALVYPTTADSDNCEAIDLLFTTTTTTPTGTPATVADVDAVLRAWESSNTNDHQSDGLPWLTKLGVDAIATGVDSANVAISTVQGDLATTIENIATVENDVTTLTNDIATPTKATAEAIASWFGGGSKPAPNPTVPEQLQSIVDALPDGATYAVIREWMTLSPELIEGTRWHLANTVTGTGDGLVAEQADLYIITTTVYPADYRVESVAGVDWTPRWGWVAPRVHGAYHQRSFQDIMPAAITCNGLLMDGLLINTLPTLEWSVDAWVLDR